MTEQLATLAEKIDLLFKHLVLTDGRKYTYEDVRRKSGVEPSTISRMRSGAIADPSFSNVVALAEAFAVPVEYFAAQMTVAEAEEYLTRARQTQYLEQLRVRRKREADDKLDLLAQRAAHLDEEGFAAIEGMINYVLKQRGAPAGANNGG